MNPKRHGGKRPGAGRPKSPNAKQTMTIRVSPVVREYLIARDNASAAIEDAIKRTKHFREWARRGEK